ncbi:MAG TPA: hypothetical protein VEG34_08900, partial [Thermoanaerobaculia bacterium]|nr:hypothetical protein [Thermoanaerobaculia bacterium]
MTISAPSFACRCTLLVLVLSLVGGLALPLRAQVTDQLCMATPAEGEAAPAFGCGCGNGDGPLLDTGDWGWGSAVASATVKALPGTVCHMNVGNVGLGDGHKIDTCANLRGRAAEVAGADCDSIAIVELLSDFQCNRLCEEDSESEACQLCNGCGAAQGSNLACERQAAVVCPSDRYEVTCTQAPLSSVGCDCLCRKKDVCAAQGPSCQEVHVRVDDLSWDDGDEDTVELKNCSEGNYATCTRCTDPYGGPSVGNCV